MRIVKKERKPLGRPRKTEETPLTERQIAFVKEFVSHDGMITKKQAALNAGYPDKSASVKASELTNPNLNPHVVAAIKRYRKELDEQYRVTYGRHVRDLQRIRDRALQDGAYSAAVQAEKARGQAQGDIYISKSEVRHGSIDSMSREEVEKALKDLADQYGASIIDITPTEKTEEKSRVGLLQGNKEKQKEVST